MPTPMRSTAKRWKDFRHTKLKWVQANIDDLVEKYPDKWVCVVDGEVVAVGSCGEAHDAADKYDARDTLVMFVEGTTYVWSN